MTPLVGPHPRFVVFEGGEGAGKSTAAAAVAALLAREGTEVVLTREPGGTEAGELIRALLHRSLAPWAETFAFLAARAQLVAEVIRPALARGAFVLCDRYSASTLAYQGYGRGLELDTLAIADGAATGGLSPGLTAWLDLDPAAGLARKQGEADAIATGSETLAFHQRVRDGYVALATAALPGAWLRIDATLPPAAVAAAVHAAITARAARP